MKKLKKISGSCAVIALLYVSGLDEQTVLRVCGFHGFEAGLGMEDRQWQNAARDLGIDYRGISLSPCTLKQFIKNYSEGLYLVGTFDHLFVVDGGIIIDPRCEKPPGLKRIIRQAWRVR